MSVKSLYLANFCFGLLVCLACGCQIAEQLVDITSDFGTSGPEIAPALPTWQTFSFSKAERVTSHESQVLAFQALGKPATQLISLGENGTLLGWDLRSGEARRLRSLTKPGDKELPGVATFGAEHAVIAYTVGDTINVESLDGSGAHWTHSRLRARPKSLSFHAGDSALLIGGSDGRVSRWKFLAEAQAVTRADREKSFELYSAHQAVVSAVAAHPFDRAFFSGDWSGSLYAWLPYDRDDFGGEYDRNLFTGQFYAAPGTFVKATRTADRGITDITLTSDGQNLGLGTQDGYVETWRVRGFERFARKQLHAGPVLSVSLSPRGNRVASVGKDGFVRVSALVDNTDFGITADATRQLFLEISSYQVPGARLVKYITEDKAVVGTTDGVMIELDASASPLPTPTPTATPIGKEVLDTDY